MIMTDREPYDAVKPPGMSERRTGVSHPHVVVVGAGFGGLSTVQALHKAPVDITLIDQRNHHLFQPLLYQVATAGLSPADIAAPIRAITRGYRNVRVLLGEVIEVDVTNRSVSILDVSVRTIPYDILVVATGARHSYFGHEAWASFAPGLKTVEDATLIRRKILLAVERAETETDPDEYQRLLTFVVVGAGPTGVEMAGAISELVRGIAASDFRRVDPKSARIILVEAGPRPLAAFAPDLAAYAGRALQNLGVEMRLDTAVTGIDDDGVQLGTERIEARTVIWAAGVQASKAADWLRADHDRAGRVKVTDRLTLPNHPEIFVIGDTALALDTEGRPIPGLAPAAKEEGHYVGRAIRTRLRGQEPKPFRYRHYGNLATIGRNRAIIEFGRLHFKGFLAWVLWGLAHILFLIGFRNRVVVMVDWLWSYVWFRGNARLITNVEHHAPAAE
jgi:NADH:quinone reductase (non-electrogenic)